MNKDNLLFWFGVKVAIFALSLVLFRLTGFADMCIEFLKPVGISAGRIFLIGVIVLKSYITIGILSFVSLFIIYSSFKEGPDKK